MSCLISKNTLLLFLNDFIDVFKNNFCYDLVLSHSYSDISDNFNCIMATIEAASISFISSFKFESIQILFLLYYYVSAYVSANITIISFLFCPVNCLNGPILMRRLRITNIIRTGFHANGACMIQVRCLSLPKAQEDISASEKAETGFAQVYCKFFYFSIIRIINRNLSYAVYLLQDMKSMT